MAKKCVESLVVGTIDTGISIGLDDLLSQIEDKQGLFIRKGKYEILKGDLRQLSPVLFDTIMFEVRSLIGNTRMHSNTFQHVQDRISCVFNSIDLDTYINDIKVQEGYDLVMRLAKIGLQYCKENNTLVLVEGYEYFDLCKTVTNYDMICEDIREMLKANDSLLIELTDNGTVEMSRSGGKWKTSRGTEVNVVPKGIASLSENNVTFSDIVLYDTKVVKYLATMVQDGKSIKVTSKIDIVMELKNFAIVEDVGLGDFAKSILKGYGKTIELRKGSLKISTVVALRTMSCSSESFKEKYNIIHMDLETDSRYERVMEFVDAVAKSISLEGIGDVYIVGGSSLSGYSVLSGVDSNVLVIY